MTGHRRKEQMADELLRLNRLALDSEARRVRVRGGRFSGMSHAASLDVLARVDREHARRAALDWKEDAEFWGRVRLWSMVGLSFSIVAAAVIVVPWIDFGFLTPAVTP